MDLSNNESWFFLFTGSGNRPSTPPVYGTQIVFRVTPLFARPYLKILVTTQSAKPTWKFGGHLILYAGGIVSDESNVLLIDRKACWLNQWTSCYFPLLDSREFEVSTNWHVRYQSPKWFPEVNIEIYQYYDG
jgi:hypothetical protein